MDQFERKVLETVRLHSLLSSGDRVIAAVSGGPDSTALLLSLRAVAEVIGIELAAMHVNHQLRGRESDADEDFVRDLCKACRVDLEIHRAVPPARGNLERQARELRYAALCDFAGRERARVATGHSIDDQAETLLMKLIRGAGPTGLAGIYPKRESWGSDREIVIVRPLLECAREEILEYLDRHGQSYRTDSTNRKLHLDRNWIRNHLMPLLAQRLNPKVVSALARTASLSAEVSDYLQDQARAALTVCLLRDEEVVLDISKLTSLPPLMQKEVIRLALAQARGDLDRIDSVHITGVLSVCQGSSGQSIHLPGGWKAEREFESLRLTDRPPTPDFQKEVTVPGQIFVKEVGRTVQVRQTVYAGGEGCLIRCSTERLSLRNWRPGDRFLIQPGKPRRLKRIFQERKVARTLRASRLILVWKEELVWVQGIGVAAGLDQFQPGESCLEVKVL